MPTLRIDGNTLDFPPEAFITGVVGLLLSPFEEVKHIYWAQEVGQAKTIRRSFFSLLNTCLLQIRENLNVIEDEVIQECAQRIHDALAGFLEATRELIVWERANVTSYARRKHRQLTLDVGSFEISPWAAHPEYQAQLKLITESVSLYLEALVRLVSHIEPMIIDTRHEPLINQIARFRQQVPDYRINLKVGFQEYLSRKATGLLK